MDRSKTSVLLVVCAVVLVAVSLSLNIAGAQQKPAGVSFETIPTGDYHLRAFAAAQDVRQRSHEDVKAAIGFQISCNVGNYLVAPRQRASGSG